MRNWIVLLVTITAFAVYVVLGGIIFHFIEREKAKSEKQDVDKRRSDFLGELNFMSCCHTVLSCSWINNMM